MEYRIFTCTWDTVQPLKVTFLNYLIAWKMFLIHLCIRQQNSRYYWCMLKKNYLLIVELGLIISFEWLSYHKSYLFIYLLSFFLIKFNFFNFIF